MFQTFDCCSPARHKLCYRIVTMYAYALRHTNTNMERNTTHSPILTQTNQTKTPKLCTQGKNKRTNQYTFSCIINSVHWVSPELQARTQNEWQIEYKTTRPLVCFQKQASKGETNTSSAWMSLHSIIHSLSSIYVESLCCVIRAVVYAFI